LSLPLANWMLHSTRLEDCGNDICRKLILQSGIKKSRIREIVFAFIAFGYNQRSDR
jgi:hypothetical protein